MTNPPQKDDLQRRSRGPEADRLLALLLALLPACRADPPPPSAPAPGPSASSATASPLRLAPSQALPPSASASAPAPAPAGCDAPCERDDDCTVATPPSCSDCVAVIKSRRGDHACTAAGCRANVCDESAHRARCDASRRCVLAR